MTTAKLTCPHCGATTIKNGQDFKNLSSLNTHINIHCEKNPNSKTKKAVSTPGQTQDKHSHKWTLLKPTRADYARAMNAGFTKLCECGELS